jgi:transposase-like protein
VMLYVRFLLSLRNVADLLHERGIEISHETVRSSARPTRDIASRKPTRERMRPRRLWPDVCAIRNFFGHIPMCVTHINARRGRHRPR